MDLTDETEVQTRHKRHLEKLREKEDTTYGSRGEISRGSAETSERGIFSTQGPDQGTRGTDQGHTGETGRGEERMEGWPGTDGRSDQRIRSANSEAINTDQSTGGNLQSVGASKLTTDLTPEEKAERERELTRQRVQRYRDAKREEANNQAQNRNSYVTPEATNGNGDVRFQLKNPFKVPGGKEPEKVKLLSKTEAEESREALIDLFCKGSSILDDILEIIVRDHEPVTIWEMDPDEAALFVDAHLSRAQKEQEAARTARVLIRMYDRVFTFNYLWSRSKATYTHVKDHRGLSFK